VLAIGSSQLFPSKLLPSDPFLARHRRQAMMNHATRHAMMTNATPAAAPTPALKAVVFVVGMLEEAGICWPVRLAALADPVVVVESELVLDALLAALDIVILEDSELDAEVGSDVTDDGLLLEVLLAAAEVVDIIEAVKAVETIETVVAGADELCAAELGATTDPVLVCCSPTTPIIVCAVPSET
jgi:hypothetical protein